ncbi:hypothetical protein MIR68_003858 [Amoeboaphelidium protococcarum]|nr:hypothetical protein MIR68_003858 [Amoeboaphelidium protococcarum]
MSATLLTVLAPNRIWTHDGLKDWMVIQDGKVLDIGLAHEPDVWQYESDGKSKLKYGASLCQRLVVDDNLFVLPAFTDSHIHVQILGESLSSLAVDMADIKSVQQLDEYLHKLHSDHPEFRVLSASGWNESRVEISRELLDSMSISWDMPVVVFRSCLHECIVNSKALELFGLLSPEGFTTNLRVADGDHDVQDLHLQQLRSFFARHLDSSVLIGRDQSNNLNGILKESALFEVKKFIYLSYPDHVKQQIFRGGAKECLRHGVSSVQTNDFYGAWNVWKSLIDDDNIIMPLRIHLTVPYDETLPDSPFYIPKLYPGISHKGQLFCDRVKLFADGSLGAKTAALGKHYHKCNHSGHLSLTVEELFARVKDAHDRGWRLEVHAIGDYAASVVLDAFENAGVTREHRHILTHCQVLTQSLIERMAKMGVIANIQPSFVTSDAPHLKQILGTDQERLKYCYAWKSLWDAGVVCAGGSDAPVESCDPLLGITASIFRTYDDPESLSRQEVLAGFTEDAEYVYKSACFNEEQTLTYEQSIIMYTTNGAYACRKDDEYSQLKVGSCADFIVVDTMIWDIDLNEEQLSASKLKQLWIGGKQVDMDAL